MITLPLYRSAEGAEAGELHALSPSKILGIGRNYRAHAAEMDADIPPEPLLFLKPPSALLEPGGVISRPRGYGRVDYEGELGVIIGKHAWRVPAAAALDHVLGYTCVNDVTVRDLQKSDRQWARAKGFDSFCPVGPSIVCGLDPTDLRITTRVNGDIRQDSRTSHMVFSVAEIIEFISRYMTLEPGDLIATGTPSGVGNLGAGDLVEIEIEGIGVLANRVADGE
jgi:2-keto-4-pentenoate hydratase/2-oxohepta-3-ene-1,7-dioic acid hydratase in catechol pathway